jgi:ribosomal protein S18 acetylase RimI-like enzyme
MTRSSHPEGRPRACAVAGTTVRSYLPGDWSRLCEIYAVARRQELLACGVEPAMAPLAALDGDDGPPEAGLLLAVPGPTVDGFVSILGGRLAWLYVDPQRQRRGVASRLVHEALARSPVRVSLQVLEGNAAAVAMYLRAGFSITGRYPGFIGPADMPVTVLEMLHEGPGPAPARWQAPARP